jgi:hypothetical protein
VRCPHCDSSDVRPFPGDLRAGLWWCRHCDARFRALPVSFREADAIGAALQLWKRTPTRDIPVEVLEIMSGWPAMSDDDIDTLYDRVVPEDKP